MSSTTQFEQPTVKPPAVPGEPIRRLTVKQYHAMVQAGILTEDDTVELLEGWLVAKMPKNPSHSSATRLTRHALEGITPPGWYVDTQEPITTLDSEPEPDVVVMRGDVRQYIDRHPGPRDLALIVEVSDATLNRDREFKKRLYASAEIPVYWIINLIDNQCEVYTDPSGPTETPDYRQRRDYARSETVPVVVDGKEIGHIAVEEMLP
jgi:Uma2 family endonuclease